MNAALSLQLPARSDAPASARRALSCLHPYLPSESLCSAKLLVSELVTNSVRHAGLSPRDWVRVLVEVDDDTVHVEVADPGMGFDGKVRTPVTGATGGYGLYLVSELSSRWGVRHDGATAVWFELRAGS